MARLRNIETLPIEPLLLRAEAAAALCGLPVSTWYQLQSAGKIPPSLRLGKARLWRLSVLRQWCELNCPPLDQFNEILKAKESSK